MEKIEVQIVQGPDSGDKPSAMAVARQRDALADTLRTKHPGKWALVSKGHRSRSAARQVRDRIRGRGPWRDFVWSVTQDPDDPDLHMICAMYPEEGITPAPEVSIQIVDPELVSPTF